MASTSRVVPVLAVVPLVAKMKMGCSDPARKTQNLVARVVPRANLEESRAPEEAATRSHVAADLVRKTNAVAVEHVQMIINHFVWKKQAMEMSSSSLLKSGFFSTIYCLKKIDTNEYHEMMKGRACLLVS